jgi:hypothetical protein
MNKHSDLKPSLGEPSKAGPCYLALRVKDNIRNPRVREQLIKEIEEGGKQFDGKDERLVYDYLPERGHNNSQVMLVPHAQRRMDERGITVDVIYTSLGNWMKWFQREKSMQSYLAKDIEMNLARGEKVVWVDPKLKLTMVFQANIKKGQYVIVTLYWTNKPDPRAPGSCDLVSSFHYGVNMNILDRINKLANKIAATKTDYYVIKSYKGYYSIRGSWTIANFLNDAKFYKGLKNAYSAATDIKKSNDGLDVEIFSISEQKVNISVY